MYQGKGQIYVANSEVGVLRIMERFIYPYIEKTVSSVYWSTMETNGRSLFPNLVLSRYILGCCHVQPWSFQDLYSTCHQKLLVKVRRKLWLMWVSQTGRSFEWADAAFYARDREQPRHKGCVCVERIDTCPDIMQTLQLSLSNVTKYQCCNHPNCRVDCESSAAYQLSSHTRYLHQ